MKADGITAHWAIPHPFSIRPKGLKKSNDSTLYSTRKYSVQARFKGLHWLSEETCHESFHARGNGACTRWILLISFSRFDRSAVTSGGS